MRKIILLILIINVIFSYSEIRSFKIHPQDMSQMRQMFDTFLSETGKIYSDERNCKIIIEDNSENMMKYQKLYDNSVVSEQLRQVMIEARIVEVVINRDEDYGFEWELQKDFDSLGSSTKRFEANVNAPSSQYTTGGTFKLTTLNTGDFDGILNLMLQKENVNVISNPKLFVKDGKKANILIGQKIPIQNSFMKDGVVKTDTDFVDVGVKLGVSASVIGNTDNINLVINPEISNFDSWSPGDSKPIINTINAVTEVVVKNKEVLAIGGLIKVDMMEHFIKVPVLGDLPFLGKLFKRTRNNKVRKEIIIFLSPRLQKDSNVSSFDEKKDKSDKIDVEDGQIWYDLKNDQKNISFE